MPGLSVSDVVRVDVNMAPLAVPVRNFGALCIAGSSDVIDISERIREYATLDEVATDFGSAAPEFLAAEVFFEQSPQPSICYVGRFAQTATSAVLHGGILSPVQQSQALAQLNLVTNGTMQITIDGTQRTVSASPAILYGGPFPTASQSPLITTLQGIADGSFTITINGTSHNITPIDFSTIVTLDDAGAAISAAMVTAGITATTATATWNDTAGQFEIRTVATGVSQTIGFAGAVTPVTGTDVSATLQLSAGSGAINQQGSAGMDFSAITNLNGAATIITSALTGGYCWFDGQRFNIESTSTGVSSTLSYATPAGTGQDISAMLKLTQAAGASVPVDGAPPETPLACAVALRMHPEWYALTFALETDILQTDYLAVANFIEGCSPQSIFCYTTQDTRVLDPTVTNDLASQLKDETLSRTFGQYSSANLYAVCSLFGRFATVDYQANNTVITGKFKQEPGVMGEQLTETQAATLKTKRCNVYVFYSNDAAIVQEAHMANGYFIDERIGMDWLANQIQTDLFNALYTALTKIPQTDPGVHVLVTTVTNSCHLGVVNGLIAPGQWNGPPIGQISTGQQLPTGYYVFAPTVASQPQSIREQRIAPTIQCCIKLAGAIHFSDVIVNVNR
jgi:Protein of unknown function (DUF3383)